MVRKFGLTSAVKVITSRSTQLCSCVVVVYQIFQVFVITLSAVPSIFKVSKVVNKAVQNTVLRRRISNAT
jgi:hypothetical protein